eukprot:865938-Prorocentrum_lima.AAC.1
MTSSLVGSEMCIRDRRLLRSSQVFAQVFAQVELSNLLAPFSDAESVKTCLLYRSDGADDM